MAPDLMLIEPAASLAPLPTIPRQAETDEQVVAMWLHGRPAGTQAVYRSDINRALGFIGKPLTLITVGDVQAYADSRAHLAPRTRARQLSVLKSLLTWAQRIGYVQFNVGAAVTLPAIKNDLAERILPEEAVLRMIALEENPRNAAILRLLYGAGVRRAEVAGLSWRDVQERDKGGQITVFGKGGKTRVVLLSDATFASIGALRPGGADADDPVFRSREGRRLSVVQVWRIVKAAAAKAGLVGRVSPHWLRHAHVSHALDRGASAVLVRDTVGHSSIATTNAYAHARPGDSSARYLAV